MEKLNEFVLDHEEPITSTYADIFFDDDFCDYKKPLKDDLVQNNEQCPDHKDEWVSPSDFLIGIIELKPPFTSKITRGTTHEGILAIGNGVLEAERAKFLKRLTNLLNDNDCGWKYVLENEKKSVIKKVKKIYDDIFINKSKIMSKEINTFYEKSLQELESHIRSEIKVILTSARADIVSYLNFRIKEKLLQEKDILENILKKRYSSEVKKIEQYYKLLLDNEQQRYNKLINKALHERNDALSAFCQQIDAENITSAIYVMCEERKKCKIKKCILENYQTTDISEKLQKIKDRQQILDSFKERDIGISYINKSWETKIKKILQLFLKFISFGLKLLPEQTTFLLDLEHMMLLQMNEIKNQPQKASSILVEEDELRNIFQFEEPTKTEEVCENEPFIVMGDLNDPTPPRYGSRETLPYDVDLPYIRVQRQFVYAKCHKFEEIKLFLESQTCKCQVIPDRPKSEISLLSIAPKSLSTSTETVSSDEPLFVDDIERLHDCPARDSQNWAKRLTFPYLNSYLDYTEENFERVKSILGKPGKKELPPNLIDPKQFVNAELPFSATKERHHTVETQYSSQEDLYVPDLGCTCVKSCLVKPPDAPELKDSPSIQLQDLLNRRKISLRILIQNNPNLLKMFTDESFDFVL